MEQNITNQLKQAVFAGILLLSFSEAGAQNWLGMANSNYAGTNGVYLNPSSIADSRYRYYFNFWGRGVNFYNNYLSYNAPFKLNQWANGTNSPAYNNINNRPDFQQDWLTEDLNGKSKQFSFTQDLRGPSVMFPMGRNASWSINTRQRNAIQVFGLSEPFARVARYGITPSALYNGIGKLQQGAVYNSGTFSVNAESYQEISATLAGVMVNKNKSFLKGGATFKVIRGMGAAYMTGSSDLAINNNDSITLSNTNVSYGHTDRSSLFDPINHPYDIFGNKTTGSGAGIDLGFTYEYRPDKDKYTRKPRYCNESMKHSNYQWKLGASISDLGFIKHWRSAKQYTSEFTGPQGININPAMLDAFQNAGDGFENFDSSLIGQMPNASKTGFTNSLPTALNVNFDYRFTRHFYLAANWVQSLKAQDAPGMKQMSMVSLIPRIESRGFELSMPVTLSENYQNLTVGMYTRIGPVFFGSDNLGGLLGVAGNNTFRGADIYGGVAFGIGHCTWRDKYVQEDKVDPVAKRDTLMHRDTIKIVERDTIIQRDTVKVEKVINNKVLIEKEAALKKQEEAIKKREAEVARREAEVTRRENNVPTGIPSGDLKKCRDNNAVLTAELEKEKAKNTENQARIAQLEREKEDLRKQKAAIELELASCKKGQASNEELQRNRAKIVELENKIIQLEKDKIACQNRVEILEKGSKNPDPNNSRIIILQQDLDKEKARTKELEIRITQLQKELDEANRQRIACEEANKGTKVDEQTGRVLTVKEELERAKNTIRLCEEEKAKLNTSIAEKNARIAILEKDLEDLKKKQAACQADLDNCRKGTGDDNVIKITEQLKKEQDEKNKMKIELDNTKTRIAVLETENGTLKKQVETLTADLANEKAARKACEDSKAQMLEEIKLYTTQLQECKKNQQNNNQSQIQEELNKTKTELENVKSENATLKKQNETLTSELASEKAGRKACEDSKGQMLEEIKLYSTQLQECKKNQQNNNQSQIQEELNKAKAENKTLTDQNSSLKSELDNTKTKNSSLTQENTSLKQQNATLSADLENCKKSQNNSNLQEQLNNEKAANDKLRSDLESLNGRISTLQSDLTAAKARAEQCQADLESCRKNQASSEELNRVKAQLEEAKAATQNCTNQKNQVMEELKYYTSELQKSKASVADLQAQLEELRKQKSQVEAELDACKKKSEH